MRFPVVKPDNIKYTRKSQKYSVMGLLLFYFGPGLRSRPSPRPGPGTWNTAQRGDSWILLGLGPGLGTRTKHLTSCSLEKNLFAILAGIPVVSYVDETPQKYTFKQRSHLFYPRHGYGFYCRHATEGCQIRYLLDHFPCG